MFKKLFIISVFILFSTIILLIDNCYILGRIYFYVMCIFIGVSIIKNKKVQLVDVWNLSFIFIILSEIILLENVEINTLSAVKYLLIANNFINIGYLSKINDEKSFKKTSFSKVRNSKIIIPVLLLISLFYVLLKFQDALISFTLGRNAVQNESTLINALLNSLGLVTPAIVAYYFTYIRKKKLLVPVMFSMPIFIILFMGGTRFPLLFSLLGFFIVVQSRQIKKTTIKQYILGTAVLFSLFFMSSLMKSFRSSNARETRFELIKNTSRNDVPGFLAYNFMSAEGVVDMTSLMFDYYQKNPHNYGSSSGFVFYFWIPRTIWPDKPEMLGYWLIRKYRSGFADTHSASFGFTGELFSDFGLFSLIIVFFIGRLLKIAENFKDTVFKLGKFNVIIGAMLFPYTFFFVRSPITATMTFLGILFIYYVFKKLIFYKE